MNRKAWNLLLALLMIWMVGCASSRPIIPALHPSPYRGTGIESDLVLLEDINGRTFLRPQSEMCHSSPATNHAGLRVVAIRFDTSDAPGLAFYVAVFGQNKIMLSHGYVVADGEITTCYLLITAEKLPDRVYFGPVQRTAPPHS